ncbi:MAG: hypothetical protein IAE91_10325 [Ignavibacteriaceae bacterium]|nr:hypothetical protein [Ignavibacteriaceae bacterium]
MKSKKVRKETKTNAEIIQEKVKRMIELEQIKAELSLIVAEQNIEKKVMDINTKKIELELDLAEKKKASNDKKGY